MRKTKQIKNKTVRLTNPLTGRRERVPAKDAANIRTELHAIKKRVDLGLMPLPSQTKANQQRESGQTLRQALDAHYATLAPSTAQMRRAVDAAFPAAWMTSPAEKLTAQVVAEWVAKATQSPNTKAHLVAILRGAYEHGKKTGALSGGPAAWPRVKRRSHERAALIRREEAISFLEAVKAWDSAHKTSWLPRVFLFLCTGLRQGEAAALRWSAVTFQSSYDLAELAEQVRAGQEMPLDLGGRCTISIRETLAKINRQIERARPKQNSVRPVTLSAPPALWCLARLYAERAGENDEPVMPTHTRRKRETSTVIPSRLMRAWWEAAGLPPGKITGHTLRHSFASLSLHAGAGLVEIQKLLGHANSSTTHGYLHGLRGSGGASLVDSMVFQGGERGDKKPMLPPG